MFVLVAMDLNQDFHLSIVEIAEDALVDLQKRLKASLVESQLHLDFLEGTLPPMPDILPCSWAAKPLASPQGDPTDSPNPHPGPSTDLRGRNDNVGDVEAPSSVATVRLEGMVSKSGSRGKPPTASKKGASSSSLPNDPAPKMSHSLLSKLKMALATKSILGSYMCRHKEITTYLGESITPSFDIPTKEHAHPPMTLAWSQSQMNQCSSGYNRLLGEFTPSDWTWLRKSSSEGCQEASLKCNIWRCLSHSHVCTKRLRARIGKLQHHLFTIKARNKEESKDKIERLLYTVWIQNPDVDYSILGSFTAKLVESFRAECGDAVATSQGKRRRDAGPSSSYN
uniref:Uncharacterized protein n=1 Tax=Cannabis sativa TaxID=3483 RepID=A0A803PIU2_CANSA